MTRVSGFMGSDDEVNDIVRKEMSGVGVWPWIGRKLKHCLGCLLGWIIIVAVVLGIAGLIVAKTGLIEIPILSRFYHDPQPTRTVVPTNLSFTETLESQLGSAAFDFERRVAPAEFSFTLSESDLTRGIRDLVGAGALGGLEFSDAQVVLSGGEVELFWSFTRGERTTPLRLRLAPALERKPIPLRIRKAYVGEMPIWHRAVDPLFRQMVKTQLGGLPFADLVTVKNLTVREGMVDVTVMISENPEARAGERQ